MSLYEIAKYGEVQPNTETTVGSIIDVASRFLGKPSAPVNPTDLVNVANFTLGDIYFGKNSFLSDQLVMCIVKYSNWPSELCLPWNAEFGPTISMSVWEFTAAVMSEVPHEGVAPLVTSKQTTKTAQAARYGQSFRMEQDFWRSKQGHAQYAAEFKRLVNSIQETQDYDTITACINSRSKAEIRRDKKEYKNGVYTDRNAIEDEVSFYGCANKREELDIVLVQARKAIQSRQGKVTMIMIPTEASILFDRAIVITDPETLKKITTKTDETIRRLEDGTLVCEVRDFTVQKKRHVNPLISNSTIGENYKMTYNAIRNIPPGDYTTLSRSIAIYSNEYDKYIVMPFEEAFEEFKIFEQGSDKFTTKFNNWITRKNKEASGYDAKSKEYKPPHFFSNRNKDGEMKTIEFFGQMGEQFASFDVFQYVIATIEKEIGNSEDLKSQKEETLYLLNEIEEVGYDEEFFKLIPGLIGDLEASPVSGSIVLDAKPNAFGVLDLPEDVGSFTGVIPPGIYGWPWLKYLNYYTDKNPEGRWATLSKRVQKIMPFLNLMAQKLQTMMPTSEAFNVDRRPSWFHKADSFTTFFSYVLFPNTYGPIWIKSGTNKGDDEDMNVVIDYKGLSQLSEADIVAEYSNFFSSPANSRYISGDPKANLLNIKKVKAELIPALQMGRKTLKAYVSVLSSLREQESDSPMAFDDFVARINSKLPKDNVPATTAKNLRNLIGGLYMSPISERLNYTTLTIKSKSIQAEETKFRNLASVSDQYTNDLPNFVRTGGEVAKYIRTPFIMTKNIYNTIGVNEDGLVALSDASSNHLNYIDYNSPARGTKLNIGNKTSLQFISNKNKSDQPDNAYSFDSMDTGNKGPDDIINDTFEKRWEDGNNLIDDPFRRSFYFVFLLTKITGNQWRKFHKMNVFTPINIILWRLFITHRMAHMAVLQHGDDTGNNYYSNASMNIAVNNVDKTLLGNFSFYSKAFVKKPQNIEPISNIAYLGYLGGGNTRYVKDPTDFTNTTEFRNSVCSTAIPANENDLPYLLPFIYDSQTALVPINGPNNNLYMSNSGHGYSTTDYYARYWFGTNPRSTMELPYIWDSYASNRIMENYVTLSGTQINYNMQTRAFDLVEVGKGQRGQFVYPGAADIYRNKGLHFVPKNDIRIRA